MPLSTRKALLCFLGTLQQRSYSFYVLLPRRMIVSVLLFSWCVVLGRDFDVELEPGHTKADYDSVEEVKAHENSTTTEKSAEDELLVREGILDVAYYLRRFKFRGYDPRYLTEGEIPNNNLFVEFPSPPLRNIHWEEQVSQMVLPRHLDSLTITRQNGWSFVTDKDLIKQADDECLKLLDKDDKTFNVFSGPLQRFQWLTSALYYMCHYTLNENSFLENFDEDCDDFASCIDWDLGLGNKDVRADNLQPFACALYSFCPDPCCPLKHLVVQTDCLDASPCTVKTSEDKTCRFSNKENVDFESMTLNDWNITCHCDEEGTRWESKSGMCVDIDECTELESTCDYPAESCRNLPGSYKCVCSMMGYLGNPPTKVCEKDSILQQILYPLQSLQPTDNKTLSDKYRDFINKFKSMMSVTLVNNEAEPNQTDTF